ncbi:MAG: acetyl-CoA hydrolase/transferase C-terminal domain-containing protein [Caldilineaceae bacterium]
MKWTTLEEAVSVIRSGDRVFIHGGAATPKQLLKAMTDRAAELLEVELVHIHTEGEATYAKPEYARSFHTNALFIGANMREAVAEGIADYVPVFLSEAPYLFRRKVLPLNVALIQVSPPDRHGYCSLGVSVDIAHAAVQMAEYVVAQVNPNMPRTHGDGLIHTSNIDFAVEVQDEIHELFNGKASDIEVRIGRNVASLVEDGACLQMGIGGIPNAVLNSLRNHKNLGVHSEMFSDGIMELVELGVINGANKRIHPGKLVSTFIMGSRRLYDFVDDNPLIAVLDAAYVNDTAVIRRNAKVTAINSALEIDLTGQVCADSLGTKLLSGVGGQMDFMRGASLSEGGKPIIALPSITNKGVSRITPMIQPGGGVVTTRAHVHYVVTEWGVADLYAKNLRQRAQALIQIAHPDHREALERAAFERFKRM